MKTTEEIRELINRRRRQILVHSIIYYRMNENLIIDDQWSEWALELETLQNKYPEIAKTCVFADAFSNFDHSTGCNLPLDDPWGNRKAAQLLGFKSIRKWGDKDITIHARNTVN